MKYIKKAVLFILVLCMLVTFPVAASADTQRVPTAPVYSANIKIDGEDLQFVDAIPENVSGRIMIPYRVIFEYIGATVDFDEATGIISGEKDGMKLAMKSGDKNINYTAPDGTQSVIQMDVAPYIKNGRTFVPVRFISSTLGYSVGWDQDMRTVIIIDTDEIYKDMDKDFSLLLGADGLTPDETKTYQVDGKVDMCIHMGSEGADVSMTTSGLMKGSQSVVDIDMTMDDGTETVSTKGKMRTDTKQGIMEMQIEGITPEGQWQDAASSEELGVSGIDAMMSSAMSADADMTQMLLDTISISEDQYTIDTYEQMLASYDLAKEMFGDGAFEKDGNVYRATFDMSDMSFADEFAGTPGVGTKGNLMIQTDSNGKAVAASFEMMMYSDDPSAMFELIYSQRNTAEQSTAVMSLLFGGIEFKVDSSATRRVTNNSFSWS